MITFQVAMATVSASTLVCAVALTKALLLIWLFKDA